MNRLSRVLRVGWNFKPTGADADDAADAEVDSILGQRRQRARRRFFQAVLENDERGVLEGIRPVPVSIKPIPPGKRQSQSPRASGMQESFAFCSTLAPMPMRKAPLCHGTLLGGDAWLGGHCASPHRARRQCSIMTRARLATSRRDPPQLHRRTRAHPSRRAIAVDRFGDTSLWNSIARGIVQSSALLRAGADPNLTHEGAGGGTTPRRRGGSHRRIVKLSKIRSLAEWCRRRGYDIPDGRQTSRCSSTPRAGSATVLGPGGPNRASR